MQNSIPTSSRGKYELETHKTYTAAPHISEPNKCLKISPDYKFKSVTSLTELNTNTNGVFRGTVVNSKNDGKNIPNISSGSLPIAESPNI